MKKTIVLFVLTILIVGCANTEEKELCSKIVELDVQSFTEGAKYNELAKELENYFKIYCEKSNSEVCNVLDEYIEIAKSEVTLKDCSNFEDDLKELCESANEAIVSTKNFDITHKHLKIEELCGK